MQLPDDMLTEIDRLGLDLSSMEDSLREEGLVSVRRFLERLTETAKLFETWFPRLQSFEAEARRANPMPEESDLTPIEMAQRRILQSKIKQGKRIHIWNRFTATIFTAPLVVLPLVIADWPGEYRNAVFLTPGEFKAWYEAYDEPQEDLGWFVRQNWDIQPDPPADSFAMKFYNYSVPTGTTPLLVRWGISWSSLAGGEDSELWCVDSKGRESFLGHLSRKDF